MKARANIVSLYQTLLLSPDLTSAQADALAHGYATRMKEVHDRAVRLGRLGGGTLDPAMDRARDRSLNVLKG